MRKTYGKKRKKPQGGKKYSKKELTYGTAKNKWIDHVKAIKGEEYDPSIEWMEGFLVTMEEIEDWETVYDESYAIAPLLLNLLCPYRDQLEEWKTIPIVKLDKAFADVIYEFTETQPFMSMYSLIYASALLHFVRYVSEKLLRCSEYDIFNETVKAVLWVTMRHEFKFEYENEEDFKDMYQLELGENF